MEESLVRFTAHPLDKPVKGPAEGCGVGAVHVGIKDSYGVGWSEYFEDRHSKECYRVDCSDNVSGGRGARSRPHNMWLEQSHKAILQRTKEAVASGAESVVLSPDEWRVMAHFTHAVWLDVKEGEEYAEQVDTNITEGQIGTAGAIPVIIDPKATSQLEPIPGE